MHYNTPEEFNYFKEIWEHKKLGNRRHTTQLWDERAKDWARELGGEGGFSRNLRERVEAAADYLRRRGLLGTGSSVIDIGCGLGQFAAEFARSAGEVVGLDISQLMLEQAEIHAKASALKNISFLKADFQNLDVKARGWLDHFDLAFTSITPAVSTVASLEKMISVSKGYCFSCHFVQWQDELEARISNEVFQRDYAPNLSGHGRFFYALFNLLWLRGYLPETHYHQQKREGRARADLDLARYYARILGDNIVVDEEDTQRIYRYLENNAAADGLIQQNTERWYGWILWDTQRRRDQAPRPATIRRL
ncbi:MAG: methyltransferase domain-containing protein [Peptococcaceae bacterium]|jgi:SAM-dependent methyltransferase|nr:methyltransferase domain-containing protein [Peptococcaceae bacterium]